MEQVLEPGTEESQSTSRGWNHTERRRFSRGNHRKGTKLSGEQIFGERPPGQSWLARTTGYRSYFDYLFSEVVGGVDYLIIIKFS
jgi:hypothetical protein